MKEYAKIALVAAAVTVIVVWLDRSKGFIPRPAMPERQQKGDLQAT